MFSDYYRVKKCRELKRIKLRENQLKQDDNVSENPVHVIEEQINQIKYDNFPDNTNIEANETSIVTNDNFSYKSESIPSSSNDSQMILDVEEERDNDDFKEKIRQWTLRNLTTLRLNVVTDLLLLLRDEGYTSLPKSAQTLLGSTHRTVLQVMKSLYQSDGSYIHLGIEHGLKNIIPMEYDKSEIKVFVHVDGVQIYKNSQMQVWPIILKVFDNDYVTIPFVVSIYCGDSRPLNVIEFLYDFVTEAINLTRNNLIINEKVYNFKIMGIIADAQARSFLKCVKPPGSFYACERCKTRGVSVGEKNKKKRIYPEMDCQLRTKNSFKKKEQPEHHKENITTPLLSLPDFNPVKSVVLDSMHLLHLGVMKSLMGKWLNRSNVARLKKSKVTFLTLRMLALSSHVPFEFQRKKFDVRLFSNWKATQFRFFLLYCGPIVLKNILPPNQYKHFLLLFVACRILHSELNITQTEYARTLLRNFFYLLPSIYGKGSQVLNMHDLIHLPDDVEYFETSLSNISAFWGENYIGTFTKLVKSTNKPLTQIVNRLRELEAGNGSKMMKQNHVTNCVIDHAIGIYEYDGSNYELISSLNIQNYKFTHNHPNNTVQMNDNKIIQIKKNFKKVNEPTTQIKNFLFVGCEMSSGREVFNYPTSSIDVGIITVDNFLSDIKLIPCKEIKCKCILLTCLNKQYAINLLHL